MQTEIPAASADERAPTDEAVAVEWISARHVQHIVARGEAAGIAMDALLQDAGLSRARLLDVDYQVPVSALEHMLASISRDAPDPLIGLFLATEIQPSTFGAIGFIAQTCGRYGDVLEMLTRFNGLLSNIGRTSVIHGPGTVSVCWECTAGGALFRRHACEYVLGSLVMLSRLLMPAQAPIIQSVHFAHSRPADAAIIRTYPGFFQAPVYFDSSMSCVVMPASVLRIPLSHSDAFMKDMLERHALHLMQQRQRKPALADEVMHLIRALMIEQVPDKATVAGQLGISSRSLHRHLQTLGTSYRELLDRVRLAMARERLEDSHDSLTDIADHLGFSTRQAFIRWFRDQAGTTPGQYRKDITP